MNTSSNDAENARSTQSLPIRLWHWSQEIQSNDLNIVRRGQQFNKLSIGLLVQVTLIFILQLIIPSEGTGIELYLMLIGLGLVCPSRTPTRTVPSPVAPKASTTR